MDSDSSTKFSFAFLLAILFHLLLIALVMMAFSFEPDISVEKPITAMQATIVDSTEEQEFDKLAAESAKKFSKSEKNRLVRAQKKAVRLMQAEKKKLLTSAAQKLVIETLLAKKQALEAAEKNRLSILEAQRLKQAQMLPLKIETNTK